MADGRIRNCKFLALLLKHFAGAHIWVYRRTDGRLGAKLLWLPAAGHHEASQDGRAPHHADALSA